jgi:membrane-associated protease RseP (regulator of RpoE activity)
MANEHEKKYNKKYGNERRLFAYPKAKYVRFIVAEAANDAVSKSYVIAKIIERYYDSLPTATIEKLKVVYNNLDEAEK